MNDSIATWAADNADLARPDPAKRTYDSTSYPWTKEVQAEFESEEFSRAFRVLQADRAFLAIVRNRPKCTREKGRRYDRTKLCPNCWARFTSKGYWRHAAVCKGPSK